MSYIIEKKVGSSIYLYEVTSYWDREKKQPRQKRRYLGKKNPETGHLIKNEKIPKLSKDYGQIYLLQNVAEQCGLIETLKKIFPTDFATLLALAIFDISEAVPLYLFPYWVESSFLSGVSKDVSRFTAKIGKMESSRLEFLKSWIKTQEVSSLFFDITSISNYAQAVEYIEWGYNRDDEKLPQMNLGVIYNENTNMPIFYQIYPGSIKDVSTLYNILTQLDFFELKDLLLILDRGFYSASNIDEMARLSIEFIIPLPKSNQLFFNLLDSNHKKFSDYRNAFDFKEEVLFHTKASVKIKERIFEAHLYFNPQRFSEQTSRFVKKLIDLEKSVFIKQFNRNRKRELMIYLKNTSKFFRIRLHENLLQLSRKPRIISEYVRRFGVTIMLTSRLKLGRESILDLYRKKDSVEKIFDSLKNELDGKRLRSHSKETIDGRLFTKFLALILYSALEKTLKERELFKQYSVREIMYELKKIKVVEMCDGKLYLTEISKRQKDIFKAFKLEIPTIGT